MSNYSARALCGAALLIAALMGVSCDRQPSSTPAAQAESPVSKRGLIEVTATLVEVPDGAIFKRDLYDYATILKYKVVKVHRGELKEETIYVGHYNPWKPRGEASDRRVKDVGGTLKQFRAGETHRMALETPIEDHFMGGIVNKYFGRHSGVIHWAVWTEPAGS